MSNDNCFCENCSRYKHYNYWQLGCFIKLNTLAKLTNTSREEVIDVVENSVAVESCSYDNPRLVLNAHEWPYTLYDISQIKSLLTDTPAHKLSNFDLWLMLNNKIYNANNDCHFYKQSIIYSVKKLFEF